MSIINVSSESIQNFMSIQPALKKKSNPIRDDEKGSPQPFMPRELQKGSPQPFMPRDLQKDSPQPFMPRE